MVADWRLLLGVFLYFTAFAGYLVALRLAPLSLVQPAITAGVTVITVMVSVMVFDENLRFVNWLGIACLLLGLVLVSWARGQGT